MLKQRYRLHPPTDLWGLYPVDLLPDIVRKSLALPRDPTQVHSCPAEKQQPIQFPPPHGGVHKLCPTQVQVSSIVSFKNNPRETQIPCHYIEIEFFCRDVSNFSLFLFSNPEFWNGWAHWILWFSESVTTNGEERTLHLPFNDFCSGEGHRVMVGPPVMACHLYQTPLNPDTSTFLHLLHLPLVPDCLPLTNQSCPMKIGNRSLFSSRIPVSIPVPF